MTTIENSQITTCFSHDRRDVIFPAEISIKRNVEISCRTGRRQNFRANPDGVRSPPGVAYIFKVKCERLGGAFAGKVTGKEILEERLEILGCKPRYLFASARAFEKIVERVHSQTENTSNRLELLKDFISSPIRIDVADLPHLLFHLEIRDDNYRKYYYNIESEYVEMKVFKNENLRAATVWDAFVDLG